jgi:hypothetical protein
MITKYFTECCDASVYIRKESESGLWCSGCNKEVFTTKSKHGGKREGSGQPSKGGVKKTFRIDADNVEKLNELETSKTDFVNEAIREYKG